MSECPCNALEPAFERGVGDFTNTINWTNYGRLGGFGESGRGSRRSRRWVAAGRRTPSLRCRERGKGRGYGCGTHVIKK